MKRECLYCKGMFVPNNSRQLYCCRSCQVKSNARERKILQASEREMEKERLEKMKPKQNRKPKYSITELAIAARKEGLSYGQYVGKYGL